MAHSARVDFAIIGAQKSGTQALRHFLGDHPDIGLSIGGHEEHYFDLYFEEDESSDYAGYHGLYTDEALEKCTGDVTPIYMWMRGCLERLQAYNPDCRLIVILRNPVERAYSHWAMEREKGKARGGFLRGIATEIALSLRPGRAQHRVYSFLSRGFYSGQLERLFAIFPRERVLVLSNDDLSLYHAETLGEVYRFLGVRDIAPPAREIVHSRQYSAMPPIWRRILRLVYAREFRRLERLLGWKLDCWRDKGAGSATPTGRENCQ